MKLRLMLPGVLLCLASLAASGADRPGAKAQQSLTGCVDEQDGQYVLLDDQMLKITRLQSTGSDQEVFAKNLGHKVQVTGTWASGQKAAFKVTIIEKLEGRCGQAK